MLKSQRGISLLELMIAVVIIGIVLSVGAPAVNNVQQNLSLSGATKNSYFLFQQARSHAVRLSSDVVVDISDGSSWCIGVTELANCDCNTAASCTVDGVEYALSSDDFPGTIMENALFGDDDQATFDGTRGLTLNSAGSFELTHGSITTPVNLNTVGLSTSPKLRQT
ncbi:GspH/FimT family pseudopilin [Alteromonas hispanica]|uniref:Type II secretion system protein H n=1 Tax=Alteromonas hispanica TaxID=315421 RepID=A0A6L9MZ68_9ALTE|nr:GspH/FimT family pseudopilin [Alteromonas hispanica]NDW22990.1 prepilin-type N-terminal cleavage/methylation domain-containing protein [Alteromonas hispanica]